MTEQIIQKLIQINNQIKQLQEEEKQLKEQLLSQMQEKEIQYQDYIIRKQERVSFKLKKDVSILDLPQEVLKTEVDIKKLKKHPNARKYLQPNITTFISIIKKSND